jgi:hypothetical protein
MLRRFGRMRDYAISVADDELGSVEDFFDDASWAVRRHSTSPSRRPSPASHQPTKGKGV